MKDINKVGTIGIAIIFLNAIDFIISPFNLFNFLSFSIITLGTEYLTSRLQEEIKKNELAQNTDFMRKKVILRGGK